MAKNKQRELITAMEIERGISRGSTISAGLGYSNRSNIQVRTNGMGRLNDFFCLKVLFTLLCGKQETGVQ